MRTGPLPTPPPLFRTRGSAAVVLLLFLVLSLAWLWPVPAYLSSRVPHDRGDPFLITWILWWNTQAVPFTEAWWNAPVFFPLSGAFALSEHLFGISIFTTPLQFAWPNPVAAYNVALILSCWLCGFFAFLLGREVTGSTWAGIVAGAAFGFAPYRASQLSHLQVLTAQWMPLALLAMHAYLRERRPRWLIVFGLAWVLQATSNGYFLLFFPILIAAWLAWFVPWRLDPRPGIALLAAFLASSVTLIPSLLKYHEVHRNLALTRDPAEVVLYSAEAGTLFGVPFILSWLRIPWLLKFWPYHGPRSQEDLLFPGVTVIVLIFAAAGVAVWRRTPLAVSRRSALVFYVLAAFLMWSFALGPSTNDGLLATVVRPYSWLMILPGFDALRVPARFAMLACLAVSVAAALAFDVLRATAPAARRVLVLVIPIAIFAEGWIDAIPLFPPPAALNLPRFADGVVLELPADNPGVAAAAMLSSIEHRMPLASGYSGHVPPHYRILSASLANGDPSAILYLAEARPIVLVVNRTYDPDSKMETLARALPGIQPYGVSGSRVVFVVPPQRRVRRASGEQLPSEAITGPDGLPVRDLGSSRRVAAVSVALRSRFVDFPPRLEVQTSTDGMHWTRAWEGGTGGPALAGALEDPREVPLRITLPDVEARYLRIHPAQGWIVRELSIYAPR